MMKSNFLNLFIILFFLPLLGSCKKKADNFDISFAPLNKSKDTELNDQDNKNTFNPENNLIIKDLVPLKSKQELLSKVKFGKKDPFSQGELQSNKLNLNLKLTGFLNTEFNKYVFVSYLDNEGTITEGSIGGLNTNLLPKGAKVISINSKNMKLTINYENENFIFEL